MAKRRAKPVDVVPEDDAPPIRDVVSRATPAPAAPRHRSSLTKTQINDAFMQMPQFTEPVTLEDMRDYRAMLVGLLPGASIEVFRNVPGPVQVRVDHDERNVGVV